LPPGEALRTDARVVRAGFAAHQAYFFHGKQHPVYRGGQRHLFGEVYAAHLFLGRAAEVIQHLKVAETKPASELAVETPGGKACALAAEQNSTARL